MRPFAVTGAALLLFASAACQRGPEEGAGDGNRVQLPIGGSGSGQEAGVTPMEDRVAVIGFLNKRNGIVRDIRLKPGQAARVNNAIVRLRACETTAPWESERLTGAFLQLDVQQPDSGWRRVFSGWVYKESPSLNVVEHPVYDVWPKSCAMTYPSGAGEPEAPVASRNRSSASRSGAADEPRAVPSAAEPESQAPAPEPEPAPGPTPPSAPDNNPT